MGTTTTYPAVAVVGLGEAGAEIAGALAARGCSVSGWDVRGDRTVAGVDRARNIEGAVRGAALVISLVTANAARSVVDAAAPVLGSGAVFADLNTSGAALKRELAAAIEPTGALFADVAVMAPVPNRGLAMPLLASGTGAEKFAALLAPLGASIEVLPGGPGVAAAHKLIRSVFTKGLAAALLEADAAARAADIEDRFLRDAASTLAGADKNLVDRLLTGSRAHAARRAHELDDAAALLRELGIEPRLTLAARDVIGHAGEEPGA
jgi:3-hydroxyisobutyrate dehydrogenase-like beta-hydroxyacid dehydrogenase